MQSKFQLIKLSNLISFYNSAEDMHKSDAVSTGDLVEFLKGFSKDLTSEVTTEIREASNAVDEFISPDYLNHSKDGCEKKSSKLYNC